MEDWVFLAVRRMERSGGSASVDSFNARREILYEKKADESAFREFYAAASRQMGLEVAFKRVISEYPDLTRRGVRFVVKRAYRGKDEGAELYVEAEGKTLLLSIRTERASEPPALENFLRHELLRASDMLDPAFEYSPGAPLGGSSAVEDELIREQFAASWNESISSRLGPGRDLSAREARRTQTEFLAEAKKEVQERNRGGGGFVCPSCGFQSFDRGPSSGSCRQCSEMAQARGGSGS